MNRALIILVLTLTSALSHARTEAGINLYGNQESSGGKYGTFCSFCGPEAVGSRARKNYEKTQSRHVAESDDAQGKPRSKKKVNVNMEDPNL